MRRVARRRYLFRLNWQSGVVGVIYLGRGRWLLCLGPMALDSYLEWSLVE